MLNRLLDRPVTVTMALLVIVVLGIVSIRMLPVSLIPDVDVPYIIVQTSAPSLSAREVDETVVRPLRQQLLQLHSLEDIVCESRDGSGTIRLSFQEGSDIDYLFIEVNEKIDRTMGSLKDIDRPKVLKSDASDIPAFYINMTLKEEEPLSDDTDTVLFPVTRQFSDMSRFASEVVSKRIEQLSEVAMVDMSGYVSPELLIVPDMKILRQTGITGEEFESYIRSANVRLGSLSIRDGEYRYNVKFQSFASDRKDIEDIYINHKGRLLQVKDIAKVIEHPAKRSGLVRSDGKDAVTMAVIKQSDARMADLRKSIDRLMGQFSKDYPELEFEVTRDQTALLEYSIDNLVNNIVIGIVLACIIIFLFMQDFRSPALVALTIPTALIFTMLIFYVIGLTINIISLSGLVLGVGMMVDNTIVLTDNITARWQRGDSLRKAVVRGTSEVVAPMLSSVLTTCAVFIPLVFVSGIAGALFYDQAMAVTITLLTAYAMTVTIIPVYYWLWYRKFDSFRPSPLLEKFSFAGVIRRYESGLVWTFRHRWAGWAVFFLSGVLIVVCFIYMPKEKLPEMTYTDTLLKVDWNEHIALEGNSDRVEEMERLIGKDTEQMTSMVGMQQFVLGHSGESSASGAVMYIDCKDAETLGMVKETVAGFLDSSYPACVYSFEPSGNIFDMVFAEREAELVARLRPVGSSELDPETLAATVGKISSDLPGIGFDDIQLKKDVLYVADPRKMALYDVSYQDLLSVLRNALNENSLFNIVQGNESIPVVMGTDTRDIREILTDTWIRKGGKDIPVYSMMTQTYDEDFKYIISGVEGEYYPLEMSPGNMRPEKIMSRISDTVGRDGSFEVNFSGSVFSNREMTRELIFVLLVALVLLYLILASQFESLVQPLVIMSEIVIDIAGSLLVLWICGATINLMSLIGLVVICGIVINDSILKIDTINRLRKEGYHLKHAIMEGGQRRLKAIVMTSLTTILAVCPFLSRGNMGDDLQYPMSLVIIAGLTIGTLISLFFVPVVYYEIYRRDE